MQEINAPMFELGESNIFEEFYELLEEHRLKTSSKFSIEELYVKLSSFDKMYQQFCSRNDSFTNSVVNTYLNHCLYCFFLLFKFNGFTDRPFFWAFVRFIQFSTELLRYSDGVKSARFYYRNISQNFPTLWESDFLKIVKRRGINFNLYVIQDYEDFYPVSRRAEFDIARDFLTLEYDDWHAEEILTEKLIFSSRFEVIQTKWTKDEIIFTGLVSYEMEIDIKISDSKNRARGLLEPLYLIVAALSNIDDVIAEMEDIKFGSITAKIRLYIKSLLAKEETKAVIETTKEIVSKSVTAGTVSYMDVKKTNADVRKINKEIELIDKEMNERPSDIEAKLINALGLEKKALENEQLRIQNAKEKLELIDKLSALAAKGVLMPDEIKIDINEILILFKTDKQLEIPDVDIDSIT